MLSHIGNVAGKVACVWLFVWAFRRKYEIDYPLDRLATGLRWAVTAGGFLVASDPRQGLGYVRVAGLGIGMGFLCWPNCAHHLANLLRRKTLPEKETENIHK